MVSFFRQYWVGSTMLKLEPTSDAATMKRMKQQHEASDFTPEDMVLLDVNSCLKCGGILVQGRHGG